jgi:hypothetical protein
MHGAAPAPSKRSDLEILLRAGTWSAFIAEVYTPAKMHPTWQY